MRIAVNTRLLIERKMDGIAWFTHETMRRVVNEHPEHEFHFIFDRSFAQQYIYAANVIPHVLWPQARHPILWRIWFEYRIPPLLAKINADVFVSPDGYASLNSDVSSLIVMHDLNFEHHPENLPAGIRKYYQTNFPKFARHATRLATVSEFSKHDLIQLYGIDEDKIDVVYNGVGEDFKPLALEQADRIRHKYTGGKPYFIVVGTIHPRKNIVRILQAYDRFRESTDTDCQLIFAGRKMWWTKEMQDALKSMKHEDAVHLLGRIEHSVQLSELIASARAMIFVPVFEGFGIPVIEAQACGCPVIASDVSSIPEVAGEAAKMCDPFNVESIKNAMTLVDQDENFRKKLTEAGLKNVKRFSWEKSADGLWQSILKTVES